MSGQKATARRLIAALNDLVGQEGIEAQAGAGVALRALQARINPLITRLAACAAEAPDAELSRAIELLLERRRQNRVLMSAALTEIRRQIDLRAQALGQLRRVTPAYRPNPPVASRLNASS